MPEILINGETKAVKAGTVSSLLAELEIEPVGIAVEKNKRIVPRSTLTEEPVCEGDTIEIVHCVAGG